MTTETLALYAAIGVAVGSELLALVPGLKANSWTQLVLQILRAIATSGRK
jgi:hypothetical protein